MSELITFLAALILFAGTARLVTIAWAYRISLYTFVDLPNFLVESLNLLYSLTWYLVAALILYLYGDTSFGTVWGRNLSPITAPEWAQYTWLWVQKHGEIFSAGILGAWYLYFRFNQYNCAKKFRDGWLTLFLFLAILLSIAALRFGIRDHLYILYGTGAVIFVYLFAKINTMVELLALENSIKEGINIRINFKNPSTSPPEQDIIYIHGKIYNCVFILIKNQNPKQNKKWVVIPMSEVNSIEMPPSLHPRFIKRAKKT